MRLTTIWTLPDMRMIDRVRRTVDRAALIAAARLPKRIRFWATMLSIGQATDTGPYVNGGIPAMTIEDVLKRIKGGRK